MKPTYSYISDEQIKRMSDADLVQSLKICDQNDKFYKCQRSCEDCPQCKYLRKAEETSCNQYIYIEAARRYIDFIEKFEDDAK